MSHHVPFKQDPEMTLFWDGCSYRAKDDHTISPYAVVPQLLNGQYQVMEV